jgi:hypothetical protein
VDAIGTELAHQSVSTPGEVKREGIAPHLNEWQLGGVNLRPVNSLENQVFEPAGIPLRALLHNAREDLIFALWPEAVVDERINNRVRGFGGERGCGTGECHSA